MNTDITVTATFTAITYTITASAGTGGNISPSGSISVTRGGSQTFSITPKTGFRVADVRVDNRSVGAVTSYTFSNVTAAHTIQASFYPSRKGIIILRFPPGGQ
jgi:Divergent InlB B-repeat domain